jgi:hypothetical protein
MVLAASLLAPPASAGNAADKPRHDLTVAAKEIGGDDTNRFKMYGDVPTYPGRKLRVERKVNQGTFKRWAKEKTSGDTGRFGFRIYGGKVGSTICYRVVVPETGSHRRTKGEPSCIETKPVS